MIIHKYSVNMAVSGVGLITVLILVVYTHPTSASVDCNKALTPWRHLKPECRAHVRINKLEKLLEKSETKIAHLAAKQKEAETQIRLAKNPPGTFSAYMTGDHDYSKRQRVIFPHIIYNSGSYNTKTGIFTAPVSAVYVFNLSLRGGYPGYHYGSIRVMKGARCLGYVGIGENFTNKWRGAGSGTIIATVKKGEKVSLKAGRHRGRGLRFSGHIHTGYSFFSAFPIQYIQ